MDNKFELKKFFNDKCLRCWLIYAWIKASNKERDNFSYWLNAEILSTDFMDLLKVTQCYLLGKFIIAKGIATAFSVKSNLQIIL